MARGFNWNVFLSRNFALCLFVFFGLVSVIWSDYPFVAFKRWFRDLGFYVMPLWSFRTRIPRRRCARFCAAFVIG